MQDSEAATGTQQRLTRLRDGLLGGRGPGATTAEVSRHTCDRGKLGGVDTLAELEAVHHQTQRERVGEPAPGRPAPGIATTFKPMLLGAVGALVIRSIMSSRTRARRPGRTRDG